MRLLPAFLILQAGCWTVSRIEELGPVRVVHWHSPLGICGASDSTLEAGDGRNLVSHLSRHSLSPAGRWMVAVGWTEGSDYRLHGIDLSIPKVILTADCPNENAFAVSGPEIGPWSPDGVRVVCLSHPRFRKDPLERPEETDLLLISFGPSGAACTPLFREARRKVWNPKWSPDGSSVAFFVARGEGWSEEEGWRLVQVTLGSPPVVREVAPSTGRLGEADFTWEEGRARVVQR